MDATPFLNEYLKKLRLSTMARELDRVSRNAAESSLSYEQFLLALSSPETLMQHP